MRAALLEVLQLARMAWVEWRVWRAVHRLQRVLPDDWARSQRAVKELAWAVNDDARDSDSGLVGDDGYMYGD